MPLTLNDGLVSYYKMEDTNGTDSVNGNHMTSPLQMDVVAGKNNNALRDSVGNYVSEVVNPTGFNFSGSFTVRFWINGAAWSGTNHAFRSAYTESRGCRFLVPFGGVPEFSVYDGGGTLRTVQWGSALSTGAWHHIFGYYDQSMGKIGIKVNNGTTITLAITGHSAAQVGDEASPFSLQLSNLVDEMAIWNRFIGEAKMTEDWNSGTGLFHPFP